MTLITSNLAALGYSLAALTYLALTILILASWRQRSQAYLLVAATLLTALWASVEALSALNDRTITLGLVLELSRNAAWLALLIYILRLRIAPAPVHLRVLQSLGVILILILLFALILPFVDPALPVAPVWLLPAGFVSLSVMGLVVVEQVYRNARPEDRCPSSLCAWVWVACLSLIFICTRMVHYFMPLIPICGARAVMWSPSSRH